MFINTEMSDVVRPEGWNNWCDPMREQTVRYGEHNSSGTGAKPDERVKWSRQISAEEAAKLTMETVLGGEDGWNLARAGQLHRQR